MKKQHDLYVNNLVGDITTNPHDFYEKESQGIPPLKKWHWH